MQHLRILTSRQMDRARTTANCFIKIILDNILHQTPEKNCLLTGQWLDNNFM